MANILEKEHVNLNEMIHGTQQKSYIMSAVDMKQHEHKHLAALSHVHRICTTSTARAQHLSSKVERRSLVSSMNVCFSRSALCAQ
jgi:TnpA family transposase